MIREKIAKLALSALDTAVTAAKNFERPRYVSLAYSEESARLPPGIDRTPPTFAPGGKMLAPGNVQAHAGPLTLTIVYRAKKKPNNEEV